MKELYVRGISGLLYATLILGSVLFHQLSFTLIILLFSTLAIIEFQRLIDHKSYMPMALVVLLVYNFYQSKINTPELFYPLISVLIAHVFLVYWLFTPRTIQGLMANFPEPSNAAKASSGRCNCKAALTFALSGP